ncbi:Serpin B4 [Cyphomyrmex costatus]|uniref:Serpin B4 n=1 Tax=Cyphomyrmex costatus TaxID=456900 RepID=A0A195CVU3_9HYME|nr:Serpin B4 [Cyphomyrmex costatus]
MFADACYKFALESLKKCIMMEPKANFFFSPHLLYHKLLMVYFGAIYDFEEALGRVLYIPKGMTKNTVEKYYNCEEVNQFCYIVKGFENSYTCQTYCKIMIDDSKGLYVETMNIFSATNSVKECNFRYRPELKRHFVNNTVKCLTQGGIQNMLPSNSIDNTTEIIMFNTIYCKGQFDSSYDFDISNNENKERVIVKQANCKNKNFNNHKSEHLDVCIIEVPCKESMITTFFFFPSLDLKNDKNLTESEKLIKLIEQLTTEEGSQELRKLLDNGMTQQVDTSFPIFKIEHDMPIYELLDMLGIPDFTPDLCTAELHEFSSHSLKLGDAVHRVNINLTKSDIIATASNVLFTYNGCEHVRKVPETVDITSPGICLIYDRSHSSIIFCGMLW